MCWCTPEMKTPYCGKPECHPANLDPDGVHKFHETWAANRQPRLVSSAGVYAVQSPEETSYARHQIEEVDGFFDYTVTRQRVDSGWVYIYVTKDYPRSMTSTFVPDLHAPVWSSR